MTVALIVLIVLVVGLIGAFILTRVVSRRTGARTGEELTGGAATADREAEILDGDWGVAPPSEPAQPQDD